MSEKNAAAVAADSLGLYMLREIVDQFEQLPGFANLTQAQKQVHLQRLDQQVRKLIAEALGIIFSAEYPAVIATLGRISVGKGIAGNFDVDRTAESRHELMDRSGQKVVIVMADPDRYYSRMTEVKAGSDQGDLFHDPKQPLGHMGVEEPPTPDVGPEADAPPAQDDEGTGLDDALPAPEDSQPIDMVTPDSVWAALQAIGYRVEIMGEGLGMWSDEELHDCIVWAIAAKQFHDAGNPMPALPDSISGRLSLFRDEGGDVTPLSAAPPVVEPKREEPIPTADDIVGITAALRERGISIKGRQVSKWSQSQRIAAVSWLAGRSSQRPDFLPPPDSEAKGT